MASQKNIARQQLSRRQIERLLGRGRSRALDVARFDFHRHDLPLGRRLHDDPEAFERSRKTVLRVFAKLQRKALERALGLDDKLSRRRPRPAVDSSAPSWRPRLSPRLSDDSIGLKVRLPYTGRTFWNHLSLYLRQSFDGDGGTAMAIRFDDGARYVALEHTVDETRGRHYSLKVRLWF